MELLESKSLLAKLMATENLHIEQKNVQTASFDVKNRILTVPILDKNITGVQYDLFMGHEVGHALWTPLDGLKSLSASGVSHSIANVVEDIRIERKIKNKYPGLRSSFTKAYRELFDKNFFGTQGADLNYLNFIDRLNLQSKAGAALNIRFTEEERELVNSANTTETYEQVIELSIRIMAYMRAEKEKQQKMKLENQENDPEEFDGDFDGDFDNDDFDFDDRDGMEIDDGESEESENSTDTEKSFKSEEEESQSGIYSSGTDSSPQVKDEFESFTDNEYAKNQKKLFAENSREMVYVNIPKIETDKAIFDYKDLYKKYREEEDEHKLNYSSKCTDLEGYMKIRKETIKVVSYLAKEFEMRKNADQMKRVSTAKTGELNMNKIFSYGFSEDIFKKMTIVPDGKSHGLVMFLDWSGSMADHVSNTVKQLLSLVMFCKKVNIPYEVYSFAEPQGCETDHIAKLVEGNIHLQNHSLFNLLSSRMSATEFTYAASALVYMCCGRRPNLPRWMSMGGTPLNEAIICAMDIVPEFQKKYKLQLVNTVFLTDGEGHALRSKIELCEYSGNSTLMPRGIGTFGMKTSLVFCDKVTKHQEVVEEAYHGSQQTTALMKLLKARTGCNTIGFYITSGRTYNREIYKYYPSGSNFEMLKLQFRKDKYNIISNAGFDEYYILRSESMNTDEDTEFVVKENATTRGLVSAFSKYTNNRVANRVVLNRFIGLIA